MCQLYHITDSQADRFSVLKLWRMTLQGAAHVTERTQQYTIILPTSCPASITSQIHCRLRPLLDPYVPLLNDAAPQHGRILWQPPGSSL